MGLEYRISKIEILSMGLEYRISNIETLRMGLEYRISNIAIFDIRYSSPIFEPDPLARRTLLALNEEIEIFDTTDRYSLEYSDLVISTGDIL